MIKYLKLNNCTNQSNYYCEFETKQFLHKKKKKNSIDRRRPTVTLRELRSRKLLIKYIIISVTTNTIAVKGEHKEFTKIKK